MIKTKNLETVSKAIRAYELNELIKSATKELDALKNWFKTEIGDRGALEAGPVLISLTDSERISLDRDALMIKLGPTKLKEFEKVLQIRSIHFKKVS